MSNLITNVITIPNAH